MYVILEEIGRRLMFVSGGLINGGGSVGGERKSGAEAPRGLKPALQVRGRTPVLPASMRRRKLKSAPRGVVVGPVRHASQSGTKVKSQGQPKRGPRIMGASRGAEAPDKILARKYGGGGGS